MCPSNCLCSQMQALRENVKVKQHVVSHLIYIASVDDTVYLRIVFQKSQCIYGCPCAEKSVILYEHKIVI